jgi:hypothetical protein
MSRQTLLWGKPDRSQDSRAGKNILKIFFQAGNELACAPLSKNSLRCDSVITRPRFLFDFIFLVGLGFELRASHLQSRSFYPGHFALGFFLR